MTSKPVEDPHELRRLLDRSLDLTEQYRRERDASRDGFTRLSTRVNELEQQLFKERGRLTLSTDTVLRQVLATERMAQALTQMAESVAQLASRLTAPPPNLPPEVLRLVEMCQVSYVEAQDALKQMDFFAAVEHFRVRRRKEAAMQAATTTHATVAAAKVTLPERTTKVTKLLSPLTASVAAHLRAKRP